MTILCFIHYKILFKLLYVISRYYHAYREINVWDGQTMLELPRKPFKEAIVEMLGISIAAVRHYEVLKIPIL